MSPAAPCAIGPRLSKGLDGLLDRPCPGSPHAIEPQRNEDLSGLLIHPKKAGSTHWTARKFHGFMRVEMLMELGYSTLARWLHEHGFKLKAPQPWPGRQRQAWRETLRELLPGGAIGL